MNAFQIPTSVVERLGWVLVHSAWEFALIALVAIMIQRAMDRCSATARYWTLLVTLAGMVVSPAVTWMLQQTAERLRLRQAVQILQSTLTRVPVVIGYLRPVILLPASVLAGVPTSQLEAILAHELAHVRRHDFLVNLLQTLVETVFFYHPAVWWLFTARYPRRGSRSDCARISEYRMGTSPGRKRPAWETQRYGVRMKLTAFAESLL